MLYAAVLRQFPKSFAGVLDMAAWKKIRGFLISMCLAGAVLSLGGCAEPPDRVFFSGLHRRPVSEARIVTATPEQLRAAGYDRIGYIKSQPMTQSARIGELPQDPEAMIETLAPENSPHLRQYYAMIDEQACRQAALKGGHVLRLEEIKRTFPTFTPETAVLLGTDVGKDIKYVTSVKIWSVWRLVETRPAGQQN
jgi:hypothetical protein